MHANLFWTRCLEFGITAISNHNLKVASNAEKHKLIQIIVKPKGLLDDREAQRATRLHLNQFMLPHVLINLNFVILIHNFVFSYDQISHSPYQPSRLVLELSQT